MLYEFYLTENDYLQLQLYVHSKDLATKKRYQHYKIRYFVIWAIISLVVFFMNRMFAGILLCGAMIGALTVPYYLKEYYLQQYRKVVKNYFKDYFNKQNVLTFKDDYLLHQNEIKVSKQFDFDEIDEIIEVEKYFYIHSGTEYIIVPKEGVGNTDFKEQLNLKVTQHNLRVITDLHWRW